MRFRADENYFHCDSKIYDDGRVLSNNKVQDYLNSYREALLKLSIENEQLKIDMVRHLEALLKLSIENEQLKIDMVRHLEEIGSKTRIEEMEQKYNFDYSDEHYNVDTMDRMKMGLEPLPRSYYD